MNTANTTLPAQLVVGWTQAEKVTDEQINVLLSKLDEYANDHPHGGRDMQRLVREWLATL